MKSWRSWQRTQRCPEAYRHWYDLREEVLRTYRDDLPERIPLSRQKEFRQIKNLVIQEAARVGEFLQDFAPQGPQSEEPVESLRQKAEREDAKAQYLLGKQLLAKAKSPDQITEAVRFLTASATQGNQYAQYALGRLYLAGKQIPRDREPPIHWLTLAAEQGSEYARFLPESDGGLAASGCSPRGAAGCSGRWLVSFRTGSR